MENKKLFDAAAARLAGDPKPLAALGISNVSLGMAYKIMSKAFGQMTADERAKSYWESCSELDQIKADSDRDQA